MKRSLILTVILLLGVSSSAVKADITMTFEEFLGSNGVPISTYYSGVSFTAITGGDEWVSADATSNLYNMSSWPSGQAWNAGNYWVYGYVGAWCEVYTAGGKIAFDNADATYVELGYAAGNTFYLEAYKADGTVMDTDSGPANLRYANGNAGGPGTLRVDWNGTDHIAYVIVHDSGNYWCVDNVTTDATDIVVPVPGAILLGLLGLSAAGLKLRKFA